MKNLKYSWFIVLLTVCGFQIGRAQCSIFPFFTNVYNCFSNTANTSYTINGSTAPYTFTVVNAANNSTVINANAPSSTGSIAVLPMGNYNIFITSAVSCTAFTTIQIINNFAASNIMFNNIILTCCIV